MEHLVGQLRQAVEVDPKGIAGARVLEELHRTSLLGLESQDEDVLRRGASATGELAQAWRAKATETGEPDLARYAGHLECLASVFRAAALRTVPDNVRYLLGRKHAPRLLRELAGGDRRVSDLGGALGIDVSYAEREIMLLAQADLVRTAKQGRERWVALTGQGRRLLDRQSEVAASPRAGLSSDEAETALQAQPAEQQAGLLAAMKEISQRQKALEERNAELTASVEALRRTVVRRSEASVTLAGGQKVREVGGAYRVMGHGITHGFIKGPPADHVEVRVAGSGNQQRLIVRVPKGKEGMLKRVLKDIGAKLVIR